MIVSKTAHVTLMVRDLAWSLVGLVGWDVLIVFCEKVMRWHWVSWPSMPLALYGSAIGIVVGFRNSSAYGRWWEARTLWGAIVNESRTLARQVLTTMSPEAAATANEQEEVARCNGGWCCIKWRMSTRCVNSSGGLTRCEPWLT